MGLNKKGAVFTILALMLISYLFYIQVAVTNVKTSDNSAAFATRIAGINSIVKNVESEAQIAIFTSGFRALLASVAQVESTGQYISNLDARMRELMINGSYNGEPRPLSQGNTLQDWETRILDFVDEFGLNPIIQYEITDISHSQPYFVDISASFTIYYNDSLTRTSWNTSFDVTSQIPINGLLDPMYIVKTENQYVISINATPFVSFDSSNLTSHVQNGYYLASTSAPNYLQRLQGDFSPSEYGIESLIDKDAMGLIISINSGLTNIDYLYFNNTNTTVYTVPGMPSSFRLDNLTTNGQGRLSIYG